MQTVEPLLNIFVALTLCKVLLPDYDEKSSETGAYWNAKRKALDSAASAGDRGVAIPFKSRGYGALPEEKNGPGRENYLTYAQLTFRPMGAIVL